ncbi:DEAD/DEAH box helicase family protein [Fodinicurvata fenggangensis]|uniref:DEAD/DEAH box helicase family protein n=1 Tax=Fodinicurvata fenggangensis TaxID=1121830 RepID=UPI000479798B|nr:DEAD/DEAH box helicase family protein [Fodinicurvata fenggangensis]
MVPFLDDRRLLYGPWQAFERDVARLLICAGFHDVRVVGGANDRGADILGVKNGQIWVVQCKHTTTSSPPKAAVSEVVEAGRYYEADRMVVAMSRPPGASFREEIKRYHKVGVKVETLDPSQLKGLLAKVGEYPKARKELYPYQQDASEKFREGLTDTGRGQIILATGLGKTIVMAEVVADLFRDSAIPGNRVLVLADKRELIRQLQQGFWAQLPKWVPTHALTSEERPAFWDGITFATVQSVAGQIESLPSFGLVLVDEAHHIGSPTFLKAIDELDPPMLGGVTATPWRGDGYELDTVLGHPLVQYGIADGLKNHFLCETDYRLMADNIRWELVQKRSYYNYSISHLNKKLIIPTRDEEAAKHIYETFRNEGRRSGIVFCSTVEHAESFAATIRAFGLSAQPISAQLKPRERDKLMASFRKGQIDIITSVDLFNEGVDVPDVDLIVFMRSTHSRRIFVQQIGRGLRTSPNKDKVIVLDFVTDIRRIAEVIELEKAAEGPTEELPLGDHVINFSDQSAGSFMLEWMKDQADLMLREGDPTLELPRLDYPEAPQPGSVE